MRHHDVVLRKYAVQGVTTCCYGSMAVVWMFCWDVVVDGEGCGSAVLLIF